MSALKPSVRAALEAAKAVLVYYRRLAAETSKLERLTAEHVLMGNGLMHEGREASPIVPGVPGALEALRKRQHMWSIMETNEGFLETMRGGIDEAWAPFGPDRDPAYRFRALLEESVPSIDAKELELAMSWFRRLWCRLERDGRLVAQA
jgi:hypothetical protein